MSIFVVFSSLANSPTKINFAHKIEFHQYTLQRIIFLAYLDVCSCASSNLRPQILKLLSDTLAEENMPFTERPTSTSIKAILQLLSVLQYQLGILDRLFLASSQLFERSDQSVSRVESLETHTMRISTGHEIHRFQNLQRANLSHRHVTIELHWSLGSITAYASNKVRTSVHEGTQKIVQSSVKVLGEGRDWLVAVHPVDK